MKDNNINILFCGVGGQGILLASEIIAEAFAGAGYDVKTSAALGMAMRGGSICAHIRIGSKIYSPLIPRGEADLLISMELIETGRWMSYLKRDGLIIFLDREILSGVAISEASSKIKALKERISRLSGKRIISISYEEIARDLRDIKSANMFMLGVLSDYFSVSKRDWQKAIRRKTSFRMKDLNLAAFRLGRERSFKDKIVSSEET